MSDLRRRGPAVVRVGVNGGSGVRVELFFVRARLAEQWPMLAGPSAAAVRAMLGHPGLPDELPVLLTRRCGRWSRCVRGFGTWRTVVGARDAALLRLHRAVGLFLAERGCDLLSVTETDLIAYRAARTELQQHPVDVAARGTVLNALFMWMVEQGHLRRRPFRMARRGSPLGRGVQREMHIRHLTLEQYLYFRDVGVGGQTPDAVVDPAFRGGRRTGTARRWSWRC